MNTKEVKGTYGSYKTPCKVFVCETSAGCWYVVEGSRNVNCTTDSIEDGVDVEVLKDFDTFTSNEAIDSESQLGSEVEDSESYKRGTNVEKKTATKKTAKKKATKKKGKKAVTPKAKGDYSKKEYDKLIGRKGDEFYFLDYIFKDSRPAKMQGAVGTSVVPVTNSWYEQATSYDGIIERYLDAMSEDEWCKTLGIDEDSYKDNDELVGAIEDGIWSLYQGGGLQPFEECNSEQEAQMREIAEYSDSNEYPIFEVVGGGRQFSRKNDFDEVYDAKLLKEIEKVESSDKFEDGGNADDTNIESENAEMVLNNNRQIAHHTRELESAVKGKRVPAWVVAKVNRSASDLSDATHYLDGESKMETGGGVGSTIGEELMGGQPNSSKHSGYLLLEVIGNGKEIIVSDDGGKTKEKYSKSNGYSGYTLHYKGNQYEFVSKYAKGGGVESKSWLDGIEYLFNF